MPTYSFGISFLFEGREYVWLDKNVEKGVTYAAQVLNSEDTQRFVKTSEKAAKGPNGSTKKPVYCFVELETKEYENRCAHYGWPELNSYEDIHFTYLGKKLNTIDLKNLKRSIITEPSVIELKEKIEKIEL